MALTGIGLALLMSVLHLFPKSGFDESAMTPVLMGVIISWLFTESFGWVFAGLVVPGYMAALFLIDPRSASINVIEAIFTYGIARLLGEHLPRTGLTSRVFGRERFFLVVLVSIGVRLAVDGVILPRLAAHATWAFSVGLVVVPLTANSCWKTGIPRGIVQNGVPTLIVYLLLRFVFIPHTNLSLAGFTLATENIAASFLASPKAYILLLTGALIAAFTNVRYGWDFNGILIPALLALVVISPVKFIVTLVEVLVLILAVRVLVAVTPLRRANIEGPRRLVIFFTVDYALRFAFAAIMGRDLPGADIVDLMGFGYLLPTLLAVKASQKGITALVVLPAVSVSLAGFGVGTLIGFGAMMVDSSAATTGRAPVERVLPQAPNAIPAAALWVAALARQEGACAAVGAGLPPSKVAALVDELLLARTTRPPAYLQDQWLEGGVLLLRERFASLQDRFGDPAILAVPRSLAAVKKRVVLFASRPVSEPEVALAAGRLLANHGADTLVIAGVEESDARLRGCLGSGLAIARALAGEPRTERGLLVEVRKSKTATAHVYIHSRVGTDREVQELINQAHADGTPVEAHPMTTSEDAEVVLELPLTGNEKWLVVPTVSRSLVSSTMMAIALDGVRASQNRPSLEELLALRRLAIEPLLGAEATSRSLGFLRYSAAILGYQLLGPSPLAGGEDALALVPGESPRPLAIVARASGVKRTVLEVPRGFEDRLRDLGLRLGNVTHADAFLIGLEPGLSLFSSDVFREAHAVATSQRPSRTAAVILLRDRVVDSTRVGIAELGTWGGAGVPALQAAVEQGLKSVGVASSPAPLDLAAREATGRSLLGETPLVTVTVDSTALVATSLNAARRAARQFPELTTYDGTCGEIAARLVALLPQGGDTAPADLIDVARRAAFEESVVANRTFEAAVAHTGVRAAIASSGAGVYVVSVRRVGRTLLIGAAPTTAPAATPREAGAPASMAVGGLPQRADSFAECATRISNGGSCRVEAL